MIAEIFVDVLIQLIWFWFETTAKKFRWLWCLVFGFHTTKRTLLTEFYVRFFQAGIGYKIFTANRTGAWREILWWKQGYPSIIAGFPLLQGKNSNNVCSIWFRSKHYCIIAVFTMKFNGTVFNCWITQLSLQKFLPRPLFGIAVFSDALM